MTYILILSLLANSVTSYEYQHQAIESADLLVQEYSATNVLTKSEFLQLYNSLRCSNEDQKIVLNQNDHVDLSRNNIQSNDSSNATCLHPDIIFENYKFNSELTTTALIDVLPVIIVNIKRCQSISAPESGETRGGRPSTGEIWGYGIGFAVLIFLISNIGAMLAPFMGVKIFDQLLMFMVAMAVGTLAATSLLVLIPESLDLMKYEGVKDEYVAKTSTVCGALLFFFLSERMIKYLAVRNQTNSKAIDKINTSEVLIKNDSEQPGMVTKSETAHKHSHNLPENADGQPPSISTVAYMVVVGDGLHKFVDGLSVGAAFTENTMTGMTVALAMICEEVAHEIGDIAILLQSGLTMKKALLYNAFAALFCFLGVIIGIVLGETTSANHWIFAVAGGIFIYVALVGMLPEMTIAAETAIGNNSNPLYITLLQTVGLIIGFSVIYLVASYVDDIQL